jgi:hypothetical protein
MSRFVRGQQEQESDDHHDGRSSHEEHPELVALVRHYSEPMTPDPQSRLSVREQHLVGIVRPRVVRDVAWHKFD